jgi:hypothetical protein
MSPEQALAFSKQKVLRFWGLTGQRGWARLILGTRSRTNTTVSSFQTTGMVLPMLPASAGATAAKVLVCFFCIMLFVKFPPWGGRENSEEAKFETG